MSEEQKPTLEEEGAMLKAQAEEADAKGVGVDELPPIGEKSGADADPVKGEGEGAKQTDAGKGGEAREAEAEGAEETGGGEGTRNAGGETEGGEAETGVSKEGETPEKAEAEDKNAAKAKKEEERRNRSWRKLEEEKAQFLREKAEWETRKLMGGADGGGAVGNPVQNPEELAAAFDKLADDFENEGEFDKADDSRRKAKEVRGIIEQQAREKAAPSFRSNPQFRKAWDANVQRAINDFPEMKDTGSEFGKTVSALLHSPETAGFFSGRADGAYVAAQFADMSMRAKRVPELLKENASLKEEVKKLKQGMSIPDTGASNRDGRQKSLNDMSLAEQSAYFRRQAEAIDAGSIPVV